jgi:hypothetical protein
MPVRNRYAELEISMFFENVKDAEIQLTKDVIRDIQRLRASGVSYTNIAKTYLDRAEKGDGFEKSFLNDAAHELWKSVKAIAQNDVFESSDYKSYYRWEYNPGASHCEVCTELNGQVKTFEEWKSEGLPGHRNAGCYYNCCCDLVEVERPQSRKGGDRRVLNNVSDKPITESTEKNNTQNISLQSNENIIKLITKEFSEKIKFSKIEDLSDEDLQATHVTLKYIKNMSGEDIFKGLTIAVQEVKNVSWKGKEYPRFGVYDTDKKTVILNSKYFASNANANDKAMVEEDTFADTIMHELGHHIFEINNLLETMRDLYYKETKFFDKYNSDYARSLDKDKMLKEIYATAFSKHHRAKLYKK